MTWRMRLPRRNEEGWVAGEKGTEIRNNRSRDVNRINLLQLKRRSMVVRVDSVVCDAGFKWMCVCRPGRLAG
jgi:hypothetical protein